MKKRCDWPARVYYDGGIKFVNLPSKVTFSNGGTYFYGATGSKVKVVYAKAGEN